MYPRTTRVRRNGRLYEYTQLVESYRRRSDGMPSHRVVANLGRLPPTDVENLRLALSVVGQGKALVLAPSATDVLPPAPVANLRYLDIAVLWELWRDWKLDELLAEAMPAGEAEVASHLVVAALAIQRLVDAGSKLYATRWVPGTALPELLGFAHESFNNTRVHRVLDELDAAGPAIMARLPKLCQDRQGAFSALFLDVTDTWFVGHGPSQAEWAKTKEGRMELKIGIVLLCNQDGFPLRWDVVAGRMSDSRCMSQMMQSVAALSWAKGVPLVVDRAMGNTAVIHQMHQTDLCFVTALISTEFSSYSDAIPYAPFEQLPSPAENDRQKQVEQVAARAQETRLEKVDDTLFVLDLGTVEVPVDAGSSPEGPQAPTSPQEAMRLCRQILESVAAGQFTSQAAAGRRLGLRGGVTKNYCRLRGLQEGIQRDILEGAANHCSLDALRKLASIQDGEQQRREFDALVSSVKARSEQAPDHQQAAKAQPLPTMSVRAVVYFNPDRFVEERQRASKQLEEIEQFVSALNRKLARPESRQKPEAIRVQVDRLLHRQELLDAFQLEVLQVDIAGRKPYQIELKLDQTNWRRRRRYDGFTVLVAHPKLTLGAVDICRLYRAKDAVEKDFGKIKGLIELRPVWHRNDGKVRAHVSVCMLGLLLERILGQKLQGTSSAAMVLELLEPCRLNQYGTAPRQAVYRLTQPTPEQRGLLQRLRLSRLTDEAMVAQHIRPR